MYNPTTNSRPKKADETRGRKRARHMAKSMAQKFPNVRAIIDCFEIFAEVPSSLTLHKVMFSTYKNHTTVKCLVAIAPGGGFSFVSALFPGKMSERWC